MKEGVARGGGSLLGERGGQPMVHADEADGAPDPHAGILAGDITGCCVQDLLLMHIHIP
jgi:hypothetical protein